MSPEQRTWQHHAEHIVTAIEKIERFKAQEAESDPEMYKDAIYRNLSTIGESADKLPDWLQKKYPHIPWPKIKGFRNILVHQYLGDDIDTVIINDVVYNKLSELRDAVKDMLKRHSG